MNNRPPISSSPSSSINSFRKRRQRGGPNIIYLIAGVLVLGGVILLIAWLSGPSKPMNTFLRHRNLHTNTDIHPNQHFHANRDTNSHINGNDHTYGNIFITFYLHSTSR